MAEGSLASDSNEQVLSSRDELLTPFFEAMKPEEFHRIGAEAEKFGVDSTTGAALPYDGARSVVTVLEALIERHGWSPEPEVPGGPLLALHRGGASVTLEPGGQLELSGAPLENVHQICLEMSGHLAELRDISAELNLIWLGIGFHPLARQEDLTWVPKGRYPIMRSYLPTRGQYGHDMMRRTCTVQANFDYASEEKAMRALRVSLRLSPLVTAMFANSPFYEGKAWGGRSYRARVWLDVDPSRQGLIQRVLEGGRGFVDYVEWALDAPMFLIKRDGHVIDNTSQTFRQFMAQGHRGYRATRTDWETHLNSMFPEVRLKRTIEVRGADSLPTNLICALPALWAGILYDERALDAADAFSESFTYDELMALRPAIAEQALTATFRGEKLAVYAERLLDIASGGLERRNRLNKNGKDERVHLERLSSLVSRGQSPADALLEQFGSGGLDPRRRILELAKI
ncbi:glutamate--cysteine ligase [Chondromyces crocatus]|uniref:Glutamate--cysteine ligase n=1 Tax=Chondromyces crocatus TaxID=52 RepID=A0A0K1ERA0_CHOCO|nr:glutamate-cysteine ligase family protein [Chondromyces crocatus]AKT43172.1 glutamate--cysteine ligase [Chondromyces crocatus]